MLGLPLTRGFSADTWQIVLTNNNLNAARADCRHVHGVHILWGGADSEPFSKADLSEPDKSARLRFKTPQVPSINRLADGAAFYAEGNEGLTPLPDFIQIKVHIVGRLIHDSLKQRGEMG
jgi:hypothetical protein